MEALEANHGDILPMAAKRNTRQAMSLDPPDSPSPPSSRWPEISRNTKYTVSIGTSIGILVAILALVNAFRDMGDALRHNTEAVNKLTNSAWLIQDEVDLANEMARTNPTIIVPNPKKIVSERIK